MLEPLICTMVTMKSLLEQLLCGWVDWGVALGIDVVDVGSSSDEIEVYVFLGSYAWVSAL